MPAVIIRDMSPVLHQRLKLEAERHHRSMSIPLVTEDRELLRKFPDTALSMEQFLRASPPAALRDPRSVYGRKQRKGRPGN